MLVNPEDEELLFGQFVKILGIFSQMTGTSLDEQRTDTTMFMSNVKKAGRLSLAHDVLEKAVKAILEENMTESLAKVLEKGFKTETLYKVRSTLQVLLDSKDSDEVRILERFLSEQSISDDNGKPIPKQKKDIASGSLQSAYDEDTTFERKVNVSQSGYVLDVSETCSKDNTVQLITDYAVRPNNISDKEILSKRIDFGTRLDLIDHCKWLYCNSAEH